MQTSGYAVTAAYPNVEYPSVQNDDHHAQALGLHDAVSI
jgi:hypothetical protein